MNDRIYRVGLIGVLFAVFLSSGLCAAGVTPQMALDAARTHLGSMRDVWCHETPSLAVSELHALKDPRTQELLGYVIDLEPLGFVLFSADTRLDPLIAYSYQCDFPWDEGNILLEMARTDLGLRNEALADIGEAIFASHRSSWQPYLEGTLARAATKQWPPAGSTPTGGWVETTWTQGSPYCIYCPLDPENGQRCIVGCTATAMAQIINYHSSRRNYLAEVEFNSWDRYVSDMTNPPIYIDQDATMYNFPTFNTLNGYLKDLRNRYLLNNQLNSSNMAVLCFACGVSVKMAYSSGGSGAAVSNVASALKGKFDYPSARTFIPIFTGFYDTLSRNMKDSLPAELAIYQPGYVNGHAIICDGLREIDGQDDQYHLNFGWGPSSPAPITFAWYVLPKGMPAGYTIIQSAVMSIVPPKASYQPDNLISLSENAGYTGEGIYNSDGSGQVITLNVGFGQTATYYVKVQNDGNLENEIRVIAKNDGGYNWQVRYFTQHDNTQITNKITTAGWLTSRLEPGAEELIRVEVTAPQDAFMGETYISKITSVSTTDTSFKDVVVTLTTAAVEEGYTIVPNNTYLAAGFDPLCRGVTVSYGLARPSRVNVSCYDMCGRLVKILIDEVKASGRYSVRWDTRDSEGLEVAAGTYFFVLKSSERTLTARTIVIR